MSSRRDEMEETAKKIALGVGAVMGALGLAAGAAFLVDQATDSSQHRGRTTAPAPASASAAYLAYSERQRLSQFSPGEDDDVDDSDSDSGEQSADGDDTAGGTASKPARRKKSKAKPEAKAKAKTKARLTSCREGRTNDTATTAQATDKAALTDCAHFLADRCRYGAACHYRHSPTITVDTPACHKWPECTRLHCRYRHAKGALTQSDATAPAVRQPSAPNPKAVAQPRPVPVPVTISPPRAVVAATPSSVSAPLSSPGVERHVHYFWDVENCPVPKRASAFVVVSAVRRLVGEAEGLRERSFRCYCDATSLSKVHRTDLSQANVQLMDVPIRKPGSADRSLHLDLDRLQLDQGHAVTVVLISGDADFINKLNDLRYQHACTVVLIHSAAAPRNLRATAHRSYDWAAVAQTDTVGESEGKEPVHTASAAHSDKPTKKAGKADRGARSACAATATEAVSDDEDALQCPQCAMQTRSATSLTQHQTAKGHWWTCPAEGCQLDFITAQQLSDHSRAHRPAHAKKSGAAEKPKGKEKGKEKENAAAAFRCFDCGQDFVAKAALYQHREAKH